MLLIKDNKNYLNNYFYEGFYMQYKKEKEKRRKWENEEKSKGREKEKD